MAFVLLSPPCIASIATAKRELNDRKSLCFMLLFQTIIGYIIALLINFIGLLVNNGLILSSIIVIITISILFFSINILKKRKCRLCKVCVKGDKKCQKTVERSMI
jgi:FtsH-binding integral membrane protein